MILDFSSTTTVPVIHLVFGESDSEDTLHFVYTTGPAWQVSDTIPPKPRIDQRVFSHQRSSPFLHFSLPQLPDWFEWPLLLHFTRLATLTDFTPGAEDSRRTMTIVTSAYLLKGVKDSP